MEKEPMDTCLWAKELMARVVADAEREKDERIANDMAKFNVDINLETGTVAWPNWR